jgi:Fem-1 family protein b
MEVDHTSSEDKIETLILSAAHDDDVHLMETYLSTVSNPNNYLNHVYNEPYEQECTVLTIACLNGYKNMIQMLLNKFKPDLEILNIVRITDRDQKLETFENVTVLWIAAALNNFELVKLLVEHGAQVNHRSKTNSTPLRCACCNDNIELVRYLVENGADVHITKIKHFTNLVASAFNGHLQMVAYLVNELGCDVNECLDDGRSPLGAAVYHGSLELVQFLLDHGARNLLADYNHMTPLMLAVEKRRVDIANAIACLCSLIEQIEAEELLGSAFICLELGHNDLKQAFEHLSRALELRSIHQLPKPLIESTHEVFNHRQECQTIDQLKELQSNSNHMYIEALLIRERLLGPKNARYRHSLRYHGALLFDDGQSYTGLTCWMYELALHQQYSIDINKEDLREFLAIFSTMMSASLLIPIESLHKVMLVVVEELKRNPKDFDYNLHTLLFLITIVSQVQ